jgi:enhancing lycopene biosynthesis protein 2
LVLLSGCGVFDGTEHHEMHVIHHTDGDVTKDRRNVLCEAVRIARGETTPLGDVQVKDFDAVCLPGGFGRCHGHDPAYMYETTIEQIAIGIETAVNTLVEMS